MVKYYIEWAMGKGYALIDVNIPKFLTLPAQSSDEYEDEDDNRTRATEELAGYLWDNYIE